MKHLQLAIGCAICVILFATTSCKPKSKDQIVGESFSSQSPSTPSVSSPVQQQSSHPSLIRPPETKPEQVYSVDLPKLANRVQPAVILVTVFDLAGQLLRRGSGIFDRDTGKF